MKAGVAWSMHGDTFFELLVAVLAFAYVMGILELTRRGSALM